MLKSLPFMTYTLFYSRYILVFMLFCFNYNVCTHVYTCACERDWLFKLSLYVCIYTHVGFALREHIHNANI